MYEVRKKVTAAAIALLLGAFGVTLTLTGAATAATAPKTTLDCLPGWYVNPDETNLLPVQQPDGLLFDGPSLIHHAASGKLTAAAGDGTFTVDGGPVGALPLFKFETSAPYSTINKTVDGLYWSSKIPTGVGSQSSPTTLATLAGTAPYTSDTTLLSFGVGYANDKGSKVVVTVLIYNEHKYSFACVPPTTNTTPSTSNTAVFYVNCDAVRAAGKAPLLSDQPGYRADLDSNHNGVACEDTTSAVAVPVARTTTPSSTQNVGLAYTGAPASPAWIAILGGALLLTGFTGIGLVQLRRRRSRREH
jgi:hypothetical protein